MQEIAASERLLQLWETPHTLWGRLSTVDHKVIGKRYLATAFVFLSIGGVEALLMRLQLTHADNDLATRYSYPSSRIPDTLRIGRCTTRACIGMRYGF